MKQILPRVMSAACAIPCTDIPCTEVNSAKFITPEKLKETGLRQTKLQGYSLQCLDIPLVMRGESQRSCRTAVLGRGQLLPVLGLSGDAGAAGIQDWRC